MSKRFQQTRKEGAATVADRVRALLAEFYDVPAARVTCVEDQINGEYDAADNDALKLIDYAGVDWLVDDRPALLAVAQRIRPDVPDQRDFSLRVDNGTSLPCEADTLGSPGLAPTHYLFGWRDDNRLTRAWLLDADKTYDTMTDSRHTTTIRNDDGTAATYLGIGELIRAGCVLTGWEP